MAFVNDYLTEEEKKKFAGYQLKYAPKCSNCNSILGTVKRLGGMWCTLDRERKFYFFDCGVNDRDWLDGKNCFNYFALVLEESDICLAYIALEKLHGSVEKDGYEILWDFKELDNRCRNKYSDELILSYVKEALDAYGLRGKPQDENWIVKTNF